MKKGMAALLIAAVLAGNCAAETYCASTGYGPFLFTEECTVIRMEKAYTAIMALGSECFAAKDAEGWRVLDAKGNEVSNVYSELQPCGDVIACRYNSMWGLLDHEMHVLYDCLYTGIVSNGEGGYLATKTNTADSRSDGVYLLDGEGGEIATGTLTLYGLNAFSMGLSPACGPENGKMGYLNVCGEWAITPQFLYAEAFCSDGCAAVAVDAGSGLIDTEGNYVLTPKYRSVLHSEGNRLTAAMTGRVCVVYDTTEKLIVREEETECAQTEYLCDMVLLDRDGTARLIGADGNIVLEISSAQNVIAASDGVTFLRETDNGMVLTDVNSGESWLEGDTIIPLEEGFYACACEGECVIADPHGDAVASFPCSSVQRLNGRYLLIENGDGILLVDAQTGNSAILTE